MTSLHMMDLTTPAPPPERLPLPPKQDPEKTPKRDQTHVRHDGRNVA